MFESIAELTNIDVVAERKRFAIGGSIGIVCWAIISTIVVVESFYKTIPIVYASGNRGGGLVEIARVVLPPTPRTIRESNNRPVGNAMVEHEVVSATARTFAAKQGDPSSSAGEEPPNINPANVPMTGANGGGPIVSNTPTIVQPAPVPPPTPEKADPPPQSSQTQLADEIRAKIRHSTISDPSAVGTGGSKGMRLDGGAGLDLGANKELLEKRMMVAWQKTKSQYIDMQHAGRAVVVYFDWYRDGQFVFTGFGTRTGNSALDNEARNAVQNASPFVPIPKDITLEVIHLNATFTY